MCQHHEQPASDLVWGFVEIGALIGRPQRATARLLRTGAIPAAKKIGRRWVVSRAAFVREFEAA